MAKDKGESENSGKRCGKGISRTLCSKTGEERLSVWRGHSMAERV